jgi:hypothetical protein
MALGHGKPAGLVFSFYVPAGPFPSINESIEIIIPQGNLSLSTFPPSQSSGTLWTPASLATPAKLILDGTTVAWSGSNFGTTTNSGSLGGSIVANESTVTKGTQLNGKDTCLFNAVDSLKLATQNWSGNSFVFAVYKSNAANIGALISQGWASETSGYTFYPRASPGGTSGAGRSWAIGDALWFASGFSDTTQQIGISSAFTNDSNYHIICLKGGTDNIARADGNIKTVSPANTSAVTSLTAQDIIIGRGGAGEFIDAEIAFLALLQDPTTGDIEKLEGWAYHVYGNSNFSNFNNSHTYFAAPPQAAVDTNIQPPQGTITLSSTAPTNSVSNNISIAIPQGNVTLSAVASTIVQDNIRQALQGNAVLSGTAPSIVISNNISVTVPQGNVALSAVAATLTPGIVRQPLQGNVALSTVAATLTPGIVRQPTQGDLSISAVASIVTPGIVRQPLQGNTALSGTAPSRVLSDNINLSVPQGNVALSQVAPTPAIGFNFASPQGNVALSGTSPSRVVTTNIFITPPQGNVALSQVAPTRSLSNNLSFSVPQSNILVSSVAPAVSVSVARFPLQGNAVLSGTAPVVAQTFHRNIVVTQGNIALSSTEPSTGSSVGRFPLQGNAALSSVAPTVARTDHRTISPATDDLAISAVAPSAVTTLNRNIVIPQGNVSFSSVAPSIGSAFNRVPLQGDAAISRFAPVVTRTDHRTISPPTRDLLLSPTSSIIVASAHHPRTIPQANLNLSTLPAQLIPGTFLYPLGNNLILSTSNPSVIFGKVYHWRKKVICSGEQETVKSVYGAMNEVEVCSGDVNQQVNLQGKI